MDLTRRRQQRDLADRGKGDLGNGEGRSVTRESDRDVY